MAVLKIKEVEEKIRELGGNLAAVGRAFGVCRSAVHQFVAKHPGLKEACHDEREGMKDEAESSLHKAMKAGEGWAVCFYLKCQAKDRGYVERVEQTGANGGPIKTEQAGDAAAAARLLARHLAGLAGAVPAALAPPRPAGGAEDGGRKAASG